MLQKDLMNVKKTLVCIVVVLMCVMSILPIAAIYADEAPRVLDNANLLDADEKELLESLLDEIGTRQNVDVVIATVSDTGIYSVSSYADDLYDELGYGLDEKQGGVMLLISLAERDYYITTTGKCINAFSDDDIEYVGKQITGDLAVGDYASAFRTYAYLCDDFIGRVESDELSLVWIPISIGIGFMIAAVIVCVMVGKLKTVRSSNRADNYIKEGSMKLDESRDIYLYRTVTKTARPKDNGHRGGSTHVSSSGRVHGGGGGKF